jgi:glycosyltransferase involved in cell wall biosynthesis
LHVLFLPSWYPSTPTDLSGSFFREQAIALKNADCTVGVIAPSMMSLRQPLSALRSNKTIRSENDMGVFTFRQNGVNWAPRISRILAARYARSGWQLFRKYICDHGRPDLIHAHASLFGGVAAREIALRTGIPFVLSEHSSAFTRNLVSASNLKLAKATAEAATKRYAVSTPFARLLEERLAMPTHSWSVMPNLVNKSFLEAPLPPERKAGFRFVHISLLNKNKRADLIITAFAEICSRGGNAELVIGGDGPTLPALKALAQDLGVSERIIFRGKLSREQVLSELADADSFVLSSEHETFGVVLIEAMAMGLPVVATRCGGPEDIVAPENGILVPIQDVSALSSAMMEILDRREDWNRQAIRNKCRDRYGEETLCARWILEYRRVLLGREDS